MSDASRHDCTRRRWIPAHTTVTNLRMLLSTLRVGRDDRSYSLRTARRLEKVISGRYRRRERQRVDRECMLRLDDYHQLLIEAATEGLFADVLQSHPFGQPFSNVAIPQIKCKWLERAQNRSYEDIGNPPLNNLASLEPHTV